MTYLDAHAHIDHENAAAAEIVARATSSGVSTIIQSGTDCASSRFAVHLAEMFPGVFATVGFHPHNARNVDAKGMAEIEALTAHPKVVGVGETGLDFFRDYSPRPRQEEVFLAHLDLAERTGLPVVVHTRAAADRTFRILEERSGYLTVVLHCFSSPERLDTVVNRGYYVSFAGNVTYKGAIALQEAARELPDHLLLVETDAPYLAPEPLRGSTNTPAHVVHTYEFLARQRGVDLATLAAQVRENACRAYLRLAAALSGG